jgi:hypothetical protein
MNKVIDNVFIEIQHEYAKIWEDKKDMQDYCNGRVNNGLILENGSIVIFEKPRIKKDFCFSTDINGMYSEEKTNQAVEMAHHARTNQQYFVDKNMKANFGDYDQLFEYNANGVDVYTTPHYRTESRLVSLTCENYRHSEYELIKIRQGYKLTTKDIEALKKMVEQEKEKFLKRLNTYLKKYGLSKVHSWTYCSD